jgi:hypothetical protein
VFGKTLGSRPKAAGGIVVLYYYADWGSGSRAAAEYTQYEDGRDLEAYEKNNTLLYG